MALLVAFLGVLIAAIGLFGVTFPLRLIDWVGSVWARDRLWLAVTLRVLLGALLIFAAPECRAPQAIRILGVLTLLAAGGLLLLGPTRMTAFVGWWTRRPPAVIRLWSVAGVALGAFLVYAGT